MNAVYLVLSVILFCSVFIWFYLCYRLFNILETRHPEAYDRMGKPRLITNNTVSNNKLFMKFLFKREWQGLDDRGLGKLGQAMLIFFVAYLICFVFLLSGMFLINAV